MNKDQFAYLNENIVALEAERDRLKAEVEYSRNESVDRLKQWHYYRTLAEKAREALEKIDTIKATEVEGGPEDMSPQEKRWLRAFGESIAIAKEALALFEKEKP